MVVRANPFAAAVVEEPTDDKPKTTFKPAPPWGSKVAQRRKAMQEMTRQELFEHGYITVKDLDDEELREGRCRDSRGRIPPRAKRTDLLPRDLYDAMIAEHIQRTNEKLRTQMDVALETMVNIMTDDTCEPKDRMEAAKYLYERVAGRTPDRVQVQVSKAPWEDVIAGIAQISRAESHAMRNGANTIDAEVVSDGAGYAEAGEAATGEAAFDPPVGPDAAEYEPTEGDEPKGPTAAPYAPESDVPRELTPVEIELTAMPKGDLRIAPATPTPGFDSPQSTSATMPAVHNADYLRQQQEEAAALAARRKAARKKIQDAKKRRAVARAMGRDAMQPKDIQANEADGKLKFSLD